jgi:hypothetical protein
MAVVEKKRRAIMNHIFNRLPRASLALLAMAALLTACAQLAPDPGRG